MDFAASTLASRAYPSSTIIVSHDQTFARQLQAILEKDHHCRVALAPSYQDAQTILDGQRPQAVFIDLRKGGTRQDPSALLQHLVERWQNRVPVIAVSDSGYDFDWAAVADLLISGHLQLPLDRKQLADLWRAESGRSLVHEAGATAPRVLRTKSAAYKTHTPEMVDLMDSLSTVASHNVTILLVGETGTGKTTIARMVHELSPRCDAKFLTVACGTLPPELIESELFGHVKGAFTSADQSKIGKFEAAKGGSLLLDEIDILGPSQQAKLLRVIETGEFEPVGSNETRVCGARLIVASNVDLKQLMERNEFRADLYYRLNMLEFRIPPLRERPQDIVPMALDFVEEFSTAHDLRIRRVHRDFLACLKSYAWPGNVRELKNHIRRAVLFCRAGELTPSDLAPAFLQKLREHPAPAKPEPDPCALEVTLLQKVAATEREVIHRALKENNDNRAATARVLGLSRVGLYKKMKKHGMLRPREA